jgi:Transcriptional regulator, AbiEi antitoxin
MAEDGVVTLRQALAAGLSRTDVRRAVDSGRWRRLGRAIYRAETTKGADPAAARRVSIRAAVLSLGAGAVAVYDTAAELYGMAGPRRGVALHVSVPGAVAKVRVDDRVRVHQLSLPDDAVSSVHGIAVTTPLRTAAHLTCRLDRFAAVSVLDSSLNQGLLVPADLDAIPALIRGRRGAVAARRYLAKADGRAQSPLETRVRLRCSDGRVPPHELQHPIRDADGYLLAVADMAWPAATVAVEADGREPHGSLDALYEDRWRQNRMANAGWTILRFTWADTQRPDYIPETVRSALRRSRRSWG